jgi:phage shock protein PspC (stress-responsive transcriptional regulator)
MEKTTTIFIAGTTFSLTESAHEKLASYLIALKEHFGNDVSRDEIIRDIESRIAEKLGQKKERMIIPANIEAIIAEIGEPIQLDDEETREESRGDTKGRRKLYRDTDNAWLGGVASGIAVYFDINPLWVRVAFVVATLFWGASIVLYIALWILVPAAKTAGQKLEMRGIHATLENIGRAVKERAEEVRERGIVKKFFDGVANIIRAGFRIFGKVIGIALTVFPILLMIGLTIFFGAVVTNWNTSFNDFPLRGAVPDGLVLLSAATIYVVLLIPLLLLGVGGVRIIRKRAMIPTPVVIGLVGTWVIVLIVGGIAGTNIARYYAETLATNPQYQIETRDLDVLNFTEISVTDNHRVTIEKAAEQTVSVRARAMNHDKLHISVENNVLVIEEDTSQESCFFCESSGAEIVITTPDLDRVSIQNAFVYFSDYSDEELSIHMSEGTLKGGLSVSKLAMIVNRGYIQASVITDSLIVNAKHARFVLDGSAREAKLYLVDSRFGEELFVINSAKLDTKRSSASAKILQQISGDEGTALLESEDDPRNN